MSGRKVIHTGGSGQRSSGSGPERRQNSQRNISGPYDRNHRNTESARRTGGGRGGRGRGGRRDAPTSSATDLDAQLEGYFGRTEVKAEAPKAEGKAGGKAEGKAAKAAKEQQAPVDLDAQLAAYRAAAAAQ